MVENNNEKREPLLIIENLKTNFVTWKGVVKALDGVNLTIYKGETLGLVGETGCGKSVTSLSVMGLLPPTEGTIVEGKIIFDGNELTKFVGKDVWIKEKGKKAKIKSKRRIYKKAQEYMNQFRGKYMAMIFQEPMTAINPVLSIGYQLTEPLIYHQKKELAERILARQKITKEEFVMLKNAVFSQNKESIRKYNENPIYYSIIQQMNSIYYRKDLTELQKNEQIDSLIQEKKLSSLRLKFVEDYSNGKNKFVYRLPFIKGYVMKPIYKEAERRAIELLRLVGIYDPETIIKEYPHELSGGMRQRVMIAMALSCDPKLLIADEPTTALDVTTQAQILDLMKELKERTSASILFITHDLGVISDMADRVAVMYAGNVVELGNKMDIFYNPKHPYTQGLLRSIPTEKTMREKLHVIPGSIPNMINPPNGCRFHPRCEHAMEICSREKPPMKEVEKDHYVACWLY